MTSPPPRRSTPTPPTPPLDAEVGRPRTWSDHDVEQVVGRLLQAGVIIASIVVVLGATLLLVHHGRLSGVVCKLCPGSTSTGGAKRRREEQ